MLWMALGLVHVKIIQNKSYRLAYYIVYNCPTLSETDLGLAQGFVDDM